MSVKLHIKKGDMVYVNAGDSKGQQGKVLKVDAQKQRAIVEGVNISKKATKPNAKNPQGGSSLYVGVMLMLSRRLVWVVLLH